MKSDSVIVVCGGNGGIGRAVVHSMLSSGVAVINLCRRSKQHQSNRSASDNYTDIEVDFSCQLNKEEVKNKVLKFANGREVIGLVHCAGVAFPGSTISMNRHELFEMFTVNVASVVDIVQTLFPIFRAQGSGCIISISSLEGHLTYPFVSGYSSSKHALEAIISGMRMELEEFNIKVFSIIPGFVDTPIWEKASNFDYFQYRDDPLFEKLIQAKEKFIAIGENGLHPNLLADMVEKCLFKEKKGKDIIVVQSKLMEWRIPKLLPRWMREKIIKLYVGL